MIIQYVKFETTLTEEEVMAKAEERRGQFLALPGLLRKYYVKLDKPNHFGGVYVWDSKESLEAFRETELARSISKAYNVVGQPDIEVMDVLLELREKGNKF